MGRFRLRPAGPGDAASIRTLIHAAGINPLGLHWQRFVLVVDESGQMVGCGQVKPHGDGTRELASLAVQPAWRGQGAARQIIEHLLAQETPPVYLTCRSELGPLYEKFGFRVVPEPELPPYFKRLKRLVRVVEKLSGRRIQVMVWES